jgi:hypothetical protein
MPLFIPTLDLNKPALGGLIRGPLIIDPISNNNPKNNKNLNITILNTLESDLSPLISLK